MAILNGYASLAELKARVGSTAASDDSVLEQTVEAASRAIDLFTGRRFYAVTESRFYTVDRDGVVRIDPATAVSAVASDADGSRAYATAWAATDYDLLPFNASLNGEEFTVIALSPNSTRSWPWLARAVKVTGTFGPGTATTHLVREACLLWSARLYKRKDSPLGVAGFGEYGAVRMQLMDPDVKTLLAPLRDPVVA